MRNETSSERWFGFLNVFFAVGAGVVAGVLVATNCHRGGGGWLGPVLLGIFLGLISALFGLAFFVGFLRFIATLLQLTRTKTIMWRVLPEWMFLGVYGLFVYGGLVLAGIGLLAGNHAVFAVGALALITAFGFLGLLVVFGLCRIGWKRLLSTCKRG